MDSKLFLGIFSPHTHILDYIYMYKVMIHLNCKSIPYLLKVQVYCFLSH